MKKSFIAIVGPTCLLALVVMAVMGAVTYPPSSGTGSSTVITNVTIITNVSQIITTNLTVQQTLSVSGKATVNNMIISNGISFHTNSWAGPTSSVPMYLTRQKYATVTPISITSWSGLSNITCEPILLTVTNKASSNVNVYLPAGTATPERTNVYALSNGWTMKLWAEYDPDDLCVSAVFRQVRMP